MSEDLLVRITDANPQSSSGTVIVGARNGQTVFINWSQQSRQSYSDFATAIQKAGVGGSLIMDQCHFHGDAVTPKYIKYLKARGEHKYVFSGECMCPSLFAIGDRGERTAITHANSLHRAMVTNQRIALLINLLTGPTPCATPEMACEVLMGLYGTLKDDSFTPQLKLRAGSKSVTLFGVRSNNANDKTATMRMIEAHDDFYRLFTNNSSGLPVNAYKGVSFRISNRSTDFLLRRLCSGGDGMVNRFLDVIDGSPGYGPGVAVVEKKDGYSYGTHFQRLGRGRAI